jgi:PAS domain-containing protein
MQRVVREKFEFETDYRLVHPDGAVRDIHSTGHPVFSPTGDLIEYMGTVIDVTDRKRAEALFAGEKRLLEMIATGVALNEILNALCLIVEEYRPGTLASILLLRTDGLHLDSVAGPSLPKAWREEMERLPIGPCAGSCGTAAYRGSPVMVSNIATDPLWEVPEHRAAALSHGLRASWSNPILSSDRKVLGTFCIYGRETRSPGAQDLGLIEKATHLARVAIERDRAEAAVRTSEQKYRHLVDTTPAFVHTALPNGDVDFYNRGWLEYVGLPLTDLLGWGWTCMIHPEDVETIVPKWRAALEAGEPFVGESRVRRGLLNLLAGSYVLGSVPRCVFVMQLASDDPEDNRVIWTCCKNNDGELGARSAWERRNGLFAPVSDFDWDTFDNPNPNDRVTITSEDMATIFENGVKQLTRTEAVKALQALTEAGRTACYNALKLDGRFSAHISEIQGVLSWKG